jgi:hypothetical protein
MMTRIFWGLKNAEGGWLTNCERVIWDDNKPGHGPVMFKTRKDAREYKKYFKQVGTPTKMEVTFY